MSDSERAKTGTGERLTVIEGGGLSDAERAILEEAAAAYAQGRRDRKVVAGALGGWVKRAMAEMLPDGSIRTVPGHDEGPGHYVGCVELQTKHGRDWLLLIGVSFVTVIPMELVRWVCWREDADRLHPVGEPVV